MELREQLQAALGPAYTLGRELGGGGMSRVFLADETRLGRTVVVKVLAPELAAGISAERFEREIRVAASLQQANIVPLLTAGDSDGLPFFTMPYVDGQSLRARLASGNALAPAECLSILRDVTRALSYAHAHGVVHRDIKPDNVLLSHGAAEVTDFGIAKAIDAARVTPATETLTQLGSSIGTPAYMAPEQAAGDPDLDHRADIYAVGVLGYEMLEGHPPFAGTPQAIMAGHISATPPPLTKRADVPPSVSRLIMRCLAKDPAERYQSADALLADIEAVATPSGTIASASRPRPRRVLASVGAAAALVALVWFGTAGMRQKRWVRNDAVPRIKQHIELAQYDSAWMLARRAEEILPRDSALAMLWPRLARKAAMHSTPEGAQVYRASFDDTTHWIPLGTTPTDSIFLSLQTGRVRVEKPGYRTHVGLLGSGSRTFVLDRVGSRDSDMVHVPAGTFGAFLVGAEGLPSLALGDYLMDRYEVTNRQFKAFVDAGGYSKRAYWPTTMSDGGKTLDWNAALARFRDKTGRPGPAGWEAGEYPAGQADLPVGGVSWYEAAAYAKFAGKSLPTIYHWARAATVPAARYIVPGSNFNGVGPVRGSTWRGMSVYGVFDMAGNVREWCENDAGDGERFILGGGWTDPPYGFTDAYAQPAMDRSAINGIRLVRYLHQEPTLVQAQAPQRRAFRDYAVEKPVSPEVFEGYRHFFDYDRAAMNARVDSRDATQEDWIVEHVSFDAAYGNERMMALVILPRHGTPPYQPVVYFPGSGVISMTSSVRLPNEAPVFLVKSGRALIFPILKSTFERRDSLHSDLPDSTIFWREHAVMWVKDIRRTVDYLSSRADMDSTRVAYFGASWGSNLAPLSLTAEPRFKTAVLYVAGLTMERGRPEVDPMNHLPRVTLPVLMLNGKYDFFFPVELSQKPFFRLLGTPAEQKKYIVYEGGHDVPRTELISQTLSWLDRYLGPVR
ncbi:MAG: serine/threonine protein kinase [Gemmatimonadetes bacterium]|nr:serine/threonine protein kinase [Gemmatimonadota bacterium]